MSNVHGRVRSIVDGDFYLGIMVLFIDMHLNIMFEKYGRLWK